MAPKWLDVPRSDGILPPIVESLAGTWAVSLAAWTNAAGMIEWSRVKLCALRFLRGRGSLGNVVVAAVAVNAGYRLVCMATRSAISCLGHKHSLRGTAGKLPPALWDARS